MSGVTPDELGVVRLGAAGALFEGAQIAKENDSLELFADSAPDYDFLNWSLTWDVNASDSVKQQLADFNTTYATLNPLRLEVHADVVVEAVYVPKGSFFTVQAAVAPHPDGQVGAVGIQPNDGIYLADTNVTIEAFADSGYIFGGWTGDLNRTENPLRVTLDRSLALVANFYVEGSVLNINGSVSKIDGSVPGEIGGIGVASPGETRILSAKANPGYVFKSWEGDVSGSDNNVSVTISDHLTIVATFRKDDSDDDGDGLDNFAELVLWDTNHSNPDTDGDGLTDKYEVENNSSLDPNVSQLSLLNLIKADPGEPFFIPDLATNDLVYFSDLKQNPRTNESGLVKLADILSSPSDFDANLALVSDLQNDPRTSSTGLVKLSDVIDSPGSFDADLALISDLRTDPRTTETSLVLLSDLSAAVDGNRTLARIEGENDGIALVKANPEAYGADLTLISSLQLNPRTSETGLVLLSAVQADPGSFGIPGSNESIVENDVRNDLYRFIQADRGPLPHLVSDLGWFYTPAHGCGSR